MRNLKDKINFNIISKQKDLQQIEEAIKEESKYLEDDFISFKKIQTKLTKKHYIDSIRSRACEIITYLNILERLEDEISMHESILKDVKDD